MSQVKQGALIFLFGGLAIILAGGAWSVSQLTNEWAREGVEVEAQVTGVDSILAAKLNVRYVDGQGTARDGVVSVSKTQLNSRVVMVEYLPRDPAIVRSTKSVGGLFVASVAFGLPCMLLGAIGLIANRGQKSETIEL